MIPAYSEEVKITIQEKAGDTLEEQVKQLQEQVRLLRETIDYMNRQNSRMRSELDSLRTYLSK